MTTLVMPRTCDSSTTALLAPASNDKPPGLHLREVDGSFKTDAYVGADYDDSLAFEVGMEGRGKVGPLLAQEGSESEFSHGRS